MRDDGCARCGRSCGFTGWVFKDGSTICSDCHDELMWWFYVRAVMLNDPEAEIPFNNLKETK